MSDIRNRSVRLDDENYEWLSKLPGRTLNDAIEMLRQQGHGVVTDIEAPGGEALNEILELVRSLPDVTDIENVMRDVLQETNGEQPPSREVTQPAVPTGIPGVTKGMPPPSTVRTRCEHCGKNFESDSRRNKRCPGCAEAGHAASRYDCEECRLRDL